MWETFASTSYIEGKNPILFRKDFSMSEKGGENGFSPYSYLSNIALKIFYDQLIVTFLFHQTLLVD